MIFGIGLESKNNCNNQDKKEEDLSLKSLVLAKPKIQTTKSKSKKMQAAVKKISNAGPSKIIYDLKLLKNDFIIFNL